MREQLAYYGRSADGTEMPASLWDAADDAGRHHSTHVGMKWGSLDQGSVQRKSRHDQTLIIGRISSCVSGIILGLLLLLIYLSWSINHMEEEFCQAISENDRAALKILIDRKLDSFGRLEDRDKGLEEIKAWIEQFECIAVVEILPDLLDSEPPIQELLITLEAEPSGSNTRSIGIRLLPDGLRFDYK